MKIIQIISEKKNKNWKVTNWKLNKETERFGWVVEHIKPQMGFKRVMAVVDNGGLLQTWHMDIAIK